MKMHVITVIDKSSSMGPLREFVVNSLNENIKKHREEALKNDTNLTYSIISFNEKVDVNVWEKEINEIDDLSYEDYVPNGWTALWDAIGEGLNRLETNKEEYDSILLNVITDGDENQSKEHTLPQLNERIDKLNTWNRFNITFLGCDANLMKKVQQSFKSVSAGNFLAVEPKQFTSGINMMNAAVSGCHATLRSTGGTGQVGYYTNANKGLNADVTQD